MSGDKNDKKEDEAKEARKKMKTKRFGRSKKDDKRQ